MKTIPVTIDCTDYEIRLEDKKKATQMIASLAKKVKGDKEDDAEDNNKTD